MEIDLTQGCTRSPNGSHLFSAHKTCQWCCWKKDDIELIKMRQRVRELEAIEYACFRYFDHCRRVSLSARGVDCDSGEMNVRMSLMKDAEISLGMSESGEVGDAP